jgi:uncharacterized membrane protein
MSRFPWRTLLFVSLALNLLIIGAVAGAYGAGVRLQRETAAAIVDRAPGPRAFLAALPPETRVKMRRELARSWVESRELRRAAVEARREAFAAAAAEPYDAEQVRAAFGRLRQADQNAVAVFHNNVADAFATLSPEERREALEALRTAAPAARRTFVPPDDAAAETSGEDAQEQTFEERRRAWRERRRQRLEQRRQQQPPP